MEKCAVCETIETQLFLCGMPICLKCDAENSRSELIQKIYEVENRKGQQNQSRGGNVLME